MVVCTDCIRKDAVLADPKHPANFVTCVENLEQCPITNLSINYNEAGESLGIHFTRRATNLPLLKFKVSEDKPCLRPSYYPGSTDTLFIDEIRKSMTPCPVNDYFDTLTDPRYELISGGFTIPKQTFEE